MPHSAVLTLMEEWLLITAWWGCECGIPLSFCDTMPAGGLMRRTCCLYSLEEMEALAYHLAFSGHHLAEGVWDTCHNLMWEKSRLSPWPSLEGVGWRCTFSLWSLAGIEYLLSKSFWFARSAPCLSIGMERVAFPSGLFLIVPIGVPGLLACSTQSGHIRWSEHSACLCLVV